VRYHFENCVLDTDRRELHRSNEAISITPQVFDLLEYLIRNQQHVVTKDDLIRVIWSGRIVSDTAITTRINAVRSAIGDTGEQQHLIKTLPRKGFRFVGSVRETQESVETASIDNTAQRSNAIHALSSKPSIAVLPFQNMSDEAGQEYFVDGLVEDIITALSRFKALVVIARQSSFSYRGNAADIKQIGAELGVRYLLEGSLRKSGARLRITAQLIDAATGAHLWADRFDGDLEEMFDLQDKIARQVVGAIVPELDRAEIHRALHAPRSRIDAVTSYYRGLPHFHFPTTPDNNEAALADFRNATTIDPGFSPAYGGVAGCLAWRRANSWPGDYAKDNIELSSVAERVKALGTEDAFSLTNVGFNRFWCLLEFDAGIEMIERAISSNPNYASAWSARGFLRTWHGEADVAINDLEFALRLSPRDPLNYVTLLGLALGHHNARRHDDAARWTDKAIRAFPPSFLVGTVQSIVCYVGAGRLEDAQRLMAECLSQRPAMRRATHVPPPWYRSLSLREELLEAMLKAGLPD
jgi:TolB-like protein